MTLMTQVAERELVVRAQDGDREAVGALYDAYVRRIYDFCYQMLRSTADAEDVTSQAFLRAVEKLPGLRDPDAFTGWLYGIARNACLDHIGRRKRETAMPQEYEPTASAFAGASDGPPDPFVAAEAGDLSAIVWEAAATLNERDHAIFEMTVRQGLSSGEVAEALGVKPSHAYVLINRLKDSVEQALGAVVLARAARKDCPGLDAVVSRFGEERTPRMRKAVLRHVRECDACEGRRLRFGSAASLLQGIAHAAPRPEFVEGLRHRVLDGATPQPSVDVSVGARRSLAVGAGAVAALVMASVLGFASPVIDDRVPVRTTPAVVRWTPPSATPATPAPTAEPAPEAVDVAEPPARRSRPATGPSGVNRPATQPTAVPERPPTVIVTTSEPGSQQPPPEQQPPRWTPRPRPTFPGWQDGPGGQQPG